MGSSLGLTILDHTNKLIVITFRGTHSSRDWLTDFNFLLSDADDVCKRCQAHSGFLGSWRGVRDVVLTEWKTLVAGYPTYQTVVTGHSLGGAIATLSAAQMKRMVPDASLYLFTYGSPRVGDGKFAKYVEEVLGGRHFRVTHLNDPVPKLPLCWPGFVSEWKSRYTFETPADASCLNARYIPDPSTRSLVHTLREHYQQTLPLY